MSPDCPYIAHGDGDSLAACEASCGLDSACNVINYNAGGGDCVFRACTDPANPKISPTDGYRVYGTTSPKGERKAMQRVDGYMYVCIYVCMPKRVFSICIFVCNEFRFAMNYY